MRRIISVGKKTDRCFSYYDWSLSTMSDVRAHGTRNALYPGLYLTKTNESAIIYRRDENLPHNAPIDMFLPPIILYLETWKKTASYVHQNVEIRMDHYKTLSRVTTDLIMLCKRCTLERQHRFTLVLKKIVTELSSLTWCWHVDLVNTYITDSSIRHARLAFYTSWYSCFMRLYQARYSIDAESCKRRIASMPRDDAYVIRSKNRNLRCYRTKFQDMNIQSFLVTLTLFYTEMHSYPIVTDMEDYFRTLLITHGMHITYDRNNAKLYQSMMFSDTLSEKELHDEELSRNESKFIANKVSIPPMGGKSMVGNQEMQIRIRRDTLDDTEIIMFSCLQQFDLVSRLKGFTRDFLPPHMTLTQRVATEVYLMNHFISSIRDTISTVGSESFLERYYSDIFRVYQRIGERRRAIAKGRRGITDAEILEKMNPSEYPVPNDMYKKTVKDLVDVYQTEWARSYGSIITPNWNTTDVTLDEDIAFSTEEERIQSHIEFNTAQETRRSTPHEKAWILAIYINMSLMLAGTDINPELLLSWDRMDDIYVIHQNVSDCRQSGLPFLCRAGQWNYVCVPGAPVVSPPEGEDERPPVFSMRTPLLLEAMAYWTRAMVDGNHIPKQKVYQNLWAAIEKVIPEPILPYQ